MIVSREIAANALLVIMNASHEWVGESDADWKEVTDWYITLFLKGITRQNSTPMLPLSGIDLKGVPLERGQPHPSRTTRLDPAVILPSHPSPLTAPTVGSVPKTAPRSRTANSPLMQEQAEEPAKADRWDELVSVAASLFAEKTYPAASLSELATRMGMRKASLYHYIVAKEELLFELQLRAHSRALEMIREDPVIERARARDRLANLILTWSEGVMAYTKTYVPFASTDLKFLSEAHADQLRSMRETVETHLLTIVVQGIGEGDFDPNLNAHWVIDTLLSSLNSSPRWYRPRSGGSSLGYWHLQLFLEGLAPQIRRSSSNQRGRGRPSRQ